MDDQLILRVRNDIKALDESRVMLRDFLERRGVTARTLHRCELVLEETLSNTIRHGFEDGTSQAIEVHASIERDELVLIFDDDGRPFDPLSAPEPPRPTSIENTTPGGLGILLVRRTAKRMSYVATSGRNRTTIVIALEQG